MKLIVPLSALALEPGVEPSPGDSVDIQGEARVEAVQNGEARLVITRLNGVEPSVAQEEEDEPDADDSPKDEAELERQAQEIDKARYR